MATPEEERIEKKIQDAGATAPARLTPPDITDVIAGPAQYWVPPGTTTTVCALTLRNGFVVLGISACVDPANYRKALGEEIAYNKARQEIWPLEGYLLAEKRRTDLGV
jgi:hypothetical protein